MKFFLIMLCFFIHLTPSFACSLVPNEGNISDWIDDKVVFWGVPIETRWDQTREQGTPIGSTYTTIEVVRVLKGEVPKQVKVYHHMWEAACGHTFLLGEMQLVTLRGVEKNGVSISDRSLIEGIPKSVVWAYLNNGFETTFENLNIFFQRIWQEDRPSCDDSRPDNKTYCDWEDVFYAQAKSYDKEASRLNDDYLQTKNKWRVPLAAAWLYLSLRP